MEPLSVAILAGGMSRRMGQDKALLRIGGRTLIEIVASRACSLTNDLFVVASGGERFASLGFRVVSDVLPNAGSLGGVYSALLAAENEFCLVLGCDMPLVNQELLGYMANLPRDYEALVPVLEDDRSHQGEMITYETLHAIYRRSIVPTIEARIRSSHLKIADLLTDVRLRQVDEHTIRHFDPDLRTFLNVNTPDEFAEARSFLQSGPNESRGIPEE